MKGSRTEDQQIRGKLIAFLLFLVSAFDNDTKFSAQQRTRQVSSGYFGSNCAKQDGLTARMVPGHARTLQASPVTQSFTAAFHDTTGYGKFQGRSRISDNAYGIVGVQK